MENRFLLDLKVAQQLKLTTAVRLGLELLQLPLPELENALKREIEENPLIELEEEKETSPFAEPELPREDFSFVFEGGNLFVAEESEPLPLPYRESVGELLKRQAQVEFEGKELQLALYLIENLDENGFFREPLGEVASRFGLSETEAEGVRQRLLRFTPVGCGAKSLEESFKVQLEELSAPPSFVRAVEFLPLLSRSRDKFLKESGLSREEFEEFLSLLRRLDPAPGRDLGAVIPVKPDLKVWLEGEEVKVEAPQVELFNFKVNSKYLRLVKEEEARRFVREKYQRALFLKRALEQRRETLLKVGRAVFERQKEFLKSGKGLKPLTYSQVASKVGVHESTVSRAVKDKFVETPFGVFPLKLFFPKGVDGASADSVKELIREIVESEDKRKPLSDSKIAEILRERGIKLARRTVAKYREEMGIPSAFKRRV